LATVYEVGLFVEPEDANPVLTANVSENSKTSITIKNTGNGIARLKEFNLELNMTNGKKLLLKGDEIDFGGISMLLPDTTRLLDLKPKIGNATIQNIAIKQ
jgi:hypothetical protein